MRLARRPWIPVARAALVAACLVPASAAAKDVWTADEGRSSLEVSAFYKTLSSALRMPSGLVEGTAALAGLLDAARAGLPPEQAALIPTVTALPSFGGTSVNTARLWATLALWERVELTAAWQLGMNIASDRAFVGGAALGGALISRSEGASRRLVDFDPVLAEHGGFLLVHNLDRLALTLRTPFADVTLGRQVLSWGSGRLWNPTDLLSPFGPTDVDREVRRGVDAARASIPLSETAQLDVLWLPQREARDQGAVLRSQVNVGGYDVAMSVAKYVRDAVFGLDATGDVGPVGVHGEAAYTVALDRTPLGEREHFLRAVVGADVRPSESVTLMGEYSFNGWGAEDAAGYAATLQSPRVARGEVYGAGRHYLGLAAAWQASDLLTVQATAIANLQDPSAIVVPAIEYWAEQSVLVRLGGYAPLGAPPDAAALKRLTVGDLAAQNNTFKDATSSLGLKSEYGSSPLGVFVQVVVHLL